MSNPNNKDEKFSTEDSPSSSHWAFKEADGSKTRSTEAERTLSVREHSSTGFYDQMPLKSPIEARSAVALGYEIGKDNAPKVLAKGEGFIAEKIIQIAIDEGIEIREDADLVQILKAVDIESEIPLEAFTAVAEIISYIYNINSNPTLATDH